MVAFESPLDVAVVGDDDAGSMRRSPPECMDVEWANKVGDAVG